MHRFLPAVLIVAMLVGCDGDKPKAAPAPATPVATPAAIPATPATQPSAAADPVVETAGLRLNEAKQAMDFGNFESAEEKIAELEAVKDKLTSDEQATLKRYRTILSAGKATMQSMKDKLQKK